MNKNFSLNKSFLLLTILGFLLFLSLFLGQPIYTEAVDNPRVPCEACLNRVDQNYSDKSMDERYPLYINLCTQQSNSDYGYNACSAVNNNGTLLILGQGWIDIHNAQQRGGSASSIQQLECDTCVDLCSYEPWNPPGQPISECFNNCRNDTARNGSSCLRNADGAPVEPPPPVGNNGSGGGGSGPSSPSQGKPYPGFGIFKIDSCSGSNIDDPGKNDLVCVVNNAISILMTVTGAIVVVMIIISGIGYMTSAGNPTQTAWAKKSLVGSVIGLIIVVMSYSMVKLLTILLG